jgi:hypothetical protein
MMASLMRYVAWTIVLVVVASLIGWIGWQVAVRVADAREDAGGGPRNNPTAAVQVAEVEYGLIRDIRRFTGR